MSSPFFSLDADGIDVKSSTPLQLHGTSLPETVTFFIGDTKPENYQIKEEGEGAVKTELFEFQVKEEVFESHFIELEKETAVSSDCLTSKTFSLEKAELKTDEDDDQDNFCDISLSGTESQDLEELDLDLESLAFGRSLTTEAERSLGESVDSLPSSVGESIALVTFVKGKACHVLFYSLNFFPLR